MARDGNVSLISYLDLTLEMNASCLYSWLKVLRSDKNAIFKHAADAKRACDYLIVRSEAGRAGGRRPSCLMAHFHWYENVSFEPNLIFVETRNFRREGGNRSLAATATINNTNE